MPESAKAISFVSWVRNSRKENLKEMTIAFAWECLFESFFFTRGRGCRLLAARPKLYLCPSSTPTTATAAALMTLMLFDGIKSYDK